MDMNKPESFITAPFGGPKFEITAYKALQEHYPSGKTQYSTSVNLYIGGQEDPDYAVWTLGELFQLTISIWFIALKAALGKRNPNGN
jgi:hypothetical protein